MSAEKTLLAGIGSALTIAGSITKATNGPRVLLAKLGWDLPPGVDDIGLAGLDMARVGTRLTEWSDLANDPEAATEEQVIALAHLADAVIEVIEELSDLRLEAPQEYLDRTRIKDEFLTRLMDLYLIQSVVISSPPVFDIAVLLGWFELQRLDADPAKFQVKHIRNTVHWDRVPKLFTDPTDLFREVYGWGTPTFSPDTLVIRVGAVLQHIAAEVRHRQLPGIPLARMHGGPLTEHPPQLQLLLPLLGSAGPLSGEIGISVFGLPPTTPGGGDGGLGLAPYAEGTATLRLPLSSIVSLGMSATADLGSGIALVLRPDKEPVLHADLNRGQAGTGASGEIKLDLTLAMPNGVAPMTLISAGGARVEARSVAVSVGALVENARTDAIVRLELKGGRLTVKPEDLPFLGSASDEGLVVDADVDLSWSHHHGVRLGGRAELKFSKTIGRSIGPVSIDLLQLTLATTDSGLSLTAGLNASVKIGPVLLIVDQIGVRSAITPGPGSLGSADLTIRPVPPSGIGIVVDAPAVVGGGFLSLDPNKGQYAGFVQLIINEFLTVTAIGIITTRLPNGAKGFSLVVMITAEGFKPIPLGLGFTLTGIGGLIAINRTANEDFLREGVKNQTLNYLLFPKDPIRNAIQIFGALNSAFPPRIGNHLFGPVVRICWGTPALLTMELALVLEVGKRRRLIILGRVSAIMPSEKRDLLRLQMNALGVIDFDQSSISLDATLFDSRLAGKFAITGQMAMRLNWGSNPNFALSIGGFHPAFKPPSNFPVLQRLAISFSNTADFKLWAECYFAITSNTLQFGARIELLARAGGFSIEGRVGFDVLIQLDPFMFLAAFHASVQLKRGSHNLFKVKVEGELSGPRPLHVKGKATFEILWWDFSVRFDRTLVEGDRPPKLEPINVTERLMASLQESQNWSGQLPENVRRLVTVREPQDTQQIVFHPLGTLGVKQNVVPFDLEISRFGNTTPAGDRFFEIKSFTVSGNQVTFVKVKDFFSPSQFLDMNDEEKLSAPSFELLNAGLSAGVAGLLFSTKTDDILEATIEYETIIVDGQPQTDTDKSRGPITADFFARYLSLGAAARSSLRRAGNAKYRSAVKKYSLGTKGWTIVSTEDGSREGTDDFAAGTVGSYAEAFNAVKKVKASNPAKGKTLMLVRTPVD